MRAILWAAKNLQGAEVDPETPISVDWDDSYITDAETRMSQMRDDAMSGLLPRYKYLSPGTGSVKRMPASWHRKPLTKTSSLS